MSRRTVRTMKERREAAMRACNVLIYGTSEAMRGTNADIQHAIDLARLAVTDDPTPKARNEDEAADYRPPEPKCPHGKTGECNACDIAGDFAYDAAREDRVFGRR